MKKPIVCLGIMVADIVGYPVQQIPASGRLVLVDEMSLHTGGCAINASTALAYLGLPVEVIGKVGRDPFGDFLVQALRERGVGNQGIRRDDSVGTSATMVMVDPDGERRFVHYLGANAQLRLEDVDREQVAGAAILHVGGALVLPGIDGGPTAELLQFARESGVTTFLDTVWDDTGRWMTILAPCLPFVDYFVPNIAEARALTGLKDPNQVARSLLDHGVGVVALKMGAEGSLVVTADGELIRLPAYDVMTVDATGAGDAYAAGFIAGVYKGWSLDRTVRLASAVGACCVLGIGAESGLLSFSETLAFMEATPLKEA